MERKKQGETLWEKKKNLIWQTIVKKMKNISKMKEQVLQSGLMYSESYRTHVPQS